MRSYIQYRIVHCNILWKLAQGGRKGFGAYIPRWRWVQWLLDWCEPLYKGNTRMIGRIPKE